MENALLIGDHVFVDRITVAPSTHWAVFEHYRPIQRGDIIVYYSVETPDLHLVKRVIGIPGDRIHLHDGHVYRNGQLLDEPYVIRTGGNYVPYRDEFPAVPPEQAPDTVIPGWPALEGDDIIVPPSRYFVMGDNRDVSHDSRYFGCIPQENIIGRPLFIYWSFETPAGQWQKSGMATDSPSMDTSQRTSSMKRAGAGCCIQFGEYRTCRHLDHSAVDHYVQNISRNVPDSRERSWLFYQYSIASLNLCSRDTKIGILVPDFSGQLWVDKQIYFAASESGSLAVVSVFSSSRIKSGYKEEVHVC